MHVSPTYTDAPAPSPPPWPPPAAYTVAARKPVGGFAFMAPEHLLLPWQAYQQEHINALALRGYLAAREMRERRCQLAPGVQPQYGPQELGGLLGLPPERRRQAAVVQHQLTTTGLLTWTESTLAFCHHPEQVRGLNLAAYTARRAQVPAWLQRVPVPRHILQYLAREGSPGLIATTCGVLLQCLCYRDHQCVAGGRVTAAWIADCFGLSERTAARGLTQLTALGWLATVEEPHRHTQGPWRAVHLQWDFPRIRLVLPTRDTRPAPRRPRPVQLELFLWPALVPPRREAPVETPAAAPQTPTIAAPAAAQDATRDGPALALTPKAHAQLWAQATASLHAQGIADEFLIQPVLEAEVERLRIGSPTSSALASGVPDAQSETPASAIGETLPAARQNLAVYQQDSCQNLAVSSPIITSNNTDFPNVFKPFQEIQIPEPAQGRPPGASHAYALNPVPIHPPVTTHRNRASTPLEADTQDVPFPLARPLSPVAPAILTAITTSLQDAAAHSQPAVLSTPVAPSRHAAALRPPPTLRDVTPADLADVGRLLALWAQAQQRGWLSSSAADRLNVVAAAVHAQRIGQAPCRLFVALLRDRRWDVITQADEDTARAWLRTFRDGPPRRAAPAPVAPLLASVVPRSVDADVVDAVQRGLPPAWRDRPFLFLKLHDPTWTPARWAQAQAELTQWRLLQAQTNACSQLAHLGTLLDAEELLGDEEETSDTT